MRLLIPAGLWLILVGGAQAAPKTAHQRHKNAPAPAGPAVSEAAIRREADLRAADSEVLRRAARSGPGRLRREAFRAMGRIQSPSYADDLAAALSSGDPETRSEAAFDLGQLALLEPVDADEADAQRLGELRGREAAALLPSLKTGSRELRCAAAEALGKAGGPGVEKLLVEALRDDAACLRGEAALGLFRLRYLKRIPEYSSAAAAGLAAAVRAPDPELRWKAAFAFSRWPEPRAAQALSAAAHDDDARARLFAIRALGLLKAAAPADVLRAAQKDPDAMVRREAVAALGAGGQAGLLDEAVFHDPSAHVRAAAAEALADPARLDALLADASPMVRAAAVLAVPRLRKDAAAVLAKEKASPHWWVKSRAYLAMAEVPGSRADLLEGLKDPDPRVAAAALEAVAKSTEAFVVPILDRILRDPESALELRGTAADAAGERKSALLLDALEAAWKNSQGREWPEIRDSIKRAAQEAMAQPGYAGRPYFFSEPPARATASPYLGEKPAPASVVLETEKGDIELALAVEEAPVHAAAFLHSVSSGLYNGLTWHRVVSGFVIQGGDPRGSGWGDAGFFLRDEISPLRFERGTVGMPKAGKDTGGCQLFVTHVPTPHLDGRYTVFGRVVRGMDVVDRIEPGDKIVKARLSAQPSP
ncbi:MAG: peptidylprolyl isomerase [Elusimicrobia bacterium]|nr:peptidylprolyl isomerase [Elusimicrobiota bacterium]